ncbi:uncharacterized protein K452DRAFT_355365 [Aplosporella prunicola CBS 121167]|uniref:Uncharacterized protein n=1 Tax=Aplosporella prunicola CBS 121167 TaxID=1176127 RepID=A0A6A6BSB7_9PEZI|nr:uncharacterized protein K452DRAFT_355365 [Aplosporella prunicola CBS 121167]KAF2146966.1 hypothetical protein K452DRAFT_355365 [Aplosporella prunicola CBS 121167]
MDPHQRLALELPWEALENSGINPKSLAGSDTSVFMGIDSDDYSRLLLEDIPNIEPWMGIGTAHHGVPNRTSYHLDLMGASAAVDAACASSLVAVHLGRQAILTGESQISIVDGVCLSFDDDAHGYARGEGGAVIILKRLSKAISDDDNILAVLKGCAIAQDGKTNGVMAPNAKAQELVARQALERSGIDPLTVSYIEAHATSTSLGDQTEISALSAVYGTGRPAGAPAFIGFIKPNVGHLEAAAGAIDLIKAILAVNKGKLALQARLKKLNSKINWDNSGLEVVREACMRPKQSVPRRAAVCSYGYGGTVSHAIIEQTPLKCSTVSSINQTVEIAGPVILTISAPHEKRLATQAASLGDWLSDVAIAATLALRRAHLDHRVAFVVDSHEGAVNSLTAFANGAANKWRVEGRPFSASTNKDVVWDFSGHGAQIPVFYKMISSLEGIVQQELGYSAIQALESGEFADSDKIQVLTYIVKVGLSQVLKSKGVEPHAVIGHSMGEGLLHLLLPVASLRKKVKRLGGMAFVNKPFDQVKEQLRGRRDILPVVFSSPSSSVVSGKIAALQEYVESLKKEGIKTVFVKTDIAFHSPMMEELAVPLAEALSESLNPLPAKISIYSTSHADPRTTVSRNSEYWINNMTSPVRLTSAVDAAVDDGFRVFLEVSTHPIVLHSINESLAAHDLDEDMPAEKSILLAISQLHMKGSHVDFKALFDWRWSPAVPGTKWCHKPYWREVETGPPNTEITHSVEKHMLLGLRTSIAGTKTVLHTTKLDCNSKPYPGTHPVDDTEIVPAAVYINTFHYATGSSVFSDIKLSMPIAISNEPRDIQIIIQGESLKVASRLEQDGVIEEHSWITHSSCRYSSTKPPQDGHLFDIHAAKERIGTVFPNEFMIEYLNKIGVTGIAFPWAVIEHYGNVDEMVVKIDFDPEHASVTWDANSWAPLLDAATSVGSTVFFSDPKLRIISQIDKVYIYSQGQPPKSGYMYIQSSTDNKSAAANVTILNEQGELLAEFRSMRFSEVDGASGASGSVDSLVHQIAWIPPKFSENPLNLDHAVLVSEDFAVLEQYSKQLKQQTRSMFQLQGVKDLEQEDILGALNKKSSAIVYVPGSVGHLEDVPAAVERYIWEVVSIVKLITNSSLAAKVFVITNRVFAGESPTALAHGPLYGLARIVASEYPDLWGALVDNENSLFPILAVKYVQEQDVIRVQDGLPRVARMRPLSSEQCYALDSTKTLLPKPEGTYVVTGGMGALGLEICSFLVEKRARRIVIVSRRTIPPRRTWHKASGPMVPIIQRIRDLEKLGATIHASSLDIGAEDAHDLLLAEIDCLSLPPVLGVVHAAGVLEDKLVLDTTVDPFARVLRPKVSGALTLHKAFPSTTLDFFILFSSIGQLVGTLGQSSYGSGNAFLDALAVHRRLQGDNSIAFQWTAWRGLGMAASADFLTVELQNKGITDITRDDAFRAWEHIDKYDMDHAVVCRTLPINEDESVAVPILEQIVARRAESRPAESKEERNAKPILRPILPQDLRGWISVKIRECVGAVLMINDIEKIDLRTAFSDLGIDSVMTVSLRQKLQAVMKVKIPPTLTWNHPTVNHLVEWFYKKLREVARR